jgi:predicted P-loop ATPase
MNILEKIAELDIPMVQAHGTFSSATELLEFTRPLIGVEGFVVDFGGHKVKCKADQYCRIHKVKDKIRTERNILEIIINEELDDLLPILDEADQNTVREYERRFDTALETVLGRLEGLVTLARVLHGGVKKDIALNFVPNLIHKEDASFIFRVMDGKELRPLVLEHIAKSASNTARYEALEKWMEM